MAKQILIVYRPDVKPPEGYIPSIQMPDPYQAGKMLIPELEEIDVEGLDEPLYAFALPDVAARRVLGSEPHVWKFWGSRKSEDDEWSDEKLKGVMAPGNHGTSVAVEIESIQGSIKAHGLRVAKEKKAKASASTSAAAAAAAAAATGDK